MLDQEFIENIKIYPEEYLVKAIKFYRSQMSNDPQEWHEIDLDALMSIYALLSEVKDSKILEFQLPHVDFTNSMSENCMNLNGAVLDVEDEIASVSTKAKMMRIKDSFKKSLGNNFFYEFTDGDLKTIQELINDLREKIIQEINLEEEHKSRLLKRLERLQRELHKKVSDLDMFWGLIGDAGIVLGKLGTDAKPFVDRVREIANIVWRTQAQTEQLPSGTTPPLIRETDT